MRTSKKIANLWFPEHPVRLGVDFLEGSIFRLSALSVFTFRLFAVLVGTQGWPRSGATLVLPRAVTSVGRSLVVTVKDRFRARIIGLFRSRLVFGWVRDFGCSSFSAAVRVVEVTAVQQLGSEIRNGNSVVSEPLLMKSHKTWRTKTGARNLLQCVAMRERQLITTCVYVNLLNKCSSHQSCII